MRKELKWYKKTSITQNGRQQWCKIYKPTGKWIYKYYLHDYNEMINTPIKTQRLTENIMQNALIIQYLRRDMCYTQRP